jgi:hypothetical protein
LMVARKWPEAEDEMAGTSWELLSRVCTVSAETTGAAIDRPRSRTTGADEFVSEFILSFLGQVRPAGRIGMRGACR